jgi:hypothetical protein
MINWDGSEGSGHGLIHKLPQNLPVGTEENHRNLARIVDVPVESRTRMSPEQQALQKECLPVARPVRLKATSSQDKVALVIPYNVTIVI